MTNTRFRALVTSGERDISMKQDLESFTSSACFGRRVFNRSTMQKMLPREIYDNVVAAMEGREKIKEEFADPIAVAMKEWAVSLGATHYCHWFQPLTGSSAEKHDAFIEWESSDDVIEKFSGKQLIQGEPDASSFPSGGLRTTFEARGYTGWDPTSCVFVWKSGDGITLCIPSVFFSWTGDVLDSKIPLLRSDKKINDATLRLLKMTGIEAESVFSTLGTEQEYFVIDRSFRNLRPDLVMLGRTVMGAQPAKGQEMQDHYFGTVKDRILCFMHDVEEKALELGIPLKTRHNEVAPAQHEFAPVFEKASSAIDHNILLMELLRQVAIRHDLQCLLHEKPFHNFNGSGKHCNWSLSTDTGINLLNPTDTPENNLHFLVLLTAVVHGVYKHSKLLRASIGTASNDFRLGGHEAPPAIISMYLGEELEELLNSIESEDGPVKGKGKGKCVYDLGLHVTPELSQDNTDRNRTSPFAFTGNKFEFRAVGSSSSPSMPITVINLIVAESLNEIMDDIEQLVLNGVPKIDEIIPILRKYVIQSKPIRFEGDNYSADWIHEAEQRGLPNIEKSIYSYQSLLSPETVKLYSGVLTREELKSRYEILCENYANTLSIEAKMIIDLFETQVLPSAIQQQELMAKSILSTQEALGESSVLLEQKKCLKEFSELIARGIVLNEVIRSKSIEADDLDNAAKGEFYCSEILPKCLELRNVCDSLEEVVDNAIWPLPKYREMLYLV
ncbi:MAG: glutamine synthetase III [Chlamydiota bacterium]